MTATKVTTLADLFWVAANEYLKEPEEEENGISNRFACLAAMYAAKDNNISSLTIDALLIAAGLSLIDVGWSSTDYSQEEAQLGRYTLLLFLSLYCEDEGI